MNLSELTNKHRSVLELNQELWADMFRVFVHGVRGETRSIVEDVDALLPKACDGGREMLLRLAKPYRDRLEEPESVWLGTLRHAAKEGGVAVPDMPGGNE